MWYVVGRKPAGWGAKASATAPVPSGNSVGLLCSHGFIVSDGSCRRLEKACLESVFLNRHKDKWVEERLQMPLGISDRDPAARLGWRALRGAWSIIVLWSVEGQGKARINLVLKSVKKSGSRQYRQHTTVNVIYVRD